MGKLVDLTGADGGRQLTGATFQPFFQVSFSEQSYVIGRSSYWKEGCFSHGKKQRSDPYCQGFDAEAARKAINIRIQLF